MGELVHPESRQHEQELTSDLPGRAFDSGGQGRHAMGTEISPKEQEAITFAKMVSDYLETARVQHSYEKLVLVAAPTFLGLLRKNLTDATIDGGGLATLDIFPRVRDVLSDGATVITSNTVGIWRIDGDVPAWNIREAQIYGISFAAREDN